MEDLLDEKTAYPSAVNCWHFEQGLWAQTWHSPVVLAHSEEQLQQRQNLLSAKSAMEETNLL